MTSNLLALFWLLRLNRMQLGLLLLRRLVAWRKELAGLLVTHHRVRTDIAGTVLHQQFNSLGDLVNLEHNFIGANKGNEYNNPPSNPFYPTTYGT